MLARSEETGSVSPVDRAWNFSWSAVLAGAATALGLFILLMLFGTALGLSVLDPYQITRHETSYGFPAATIAWLTISAVASLFFGAWLASYITATGREGSLLEGALTWALSVILIGAGLGGLTELMPRSSGNEDSAKSLVFSYSSLEDSQFTDFLLQRVRNWTPGNPEEPINVSADVIERVDPEDVPDNGDLQKFVRAQTSLTEKQAEQFLESDKNIIAREQAEAQKRWERRHATELARADRIRKAASTAAWTLTAIAFFSLAAALGGSYLGWNQRHKNDPRQTTGSATYTPPQGSPPVSGPRVVDDQGRMV